MSDDLPSRWSREEKGPRRPGARQGDDQARRSVPGRGSSRDSGPGRPGAPGRGGSERGGSRGQERGARDTAGGQDQRGGARLAPRSPKLPEPAIADDITGHELDRGVKNQLRTLSKENAEGVAQHLVMTAMFLEADLDAAQAHAETAVRRAGRVPAAREALGLVAYRKGDWAKALSEFRTARRLSGSSHMLPLMVDAERGLGRHNRALDLAGSPEARTLPLDERIELAIVVSGIRRDLGQNDAALVGLQLPELRTAGRQPWAGRLFYAYAEALLATGRPGEARDWFARAAEVDRDGETDAEERLEQLDGVVLTDLLEDEDEDEDEDERPFGEKPDVLGRDGADSRGRRRSEDRGQRPT